LATDYNNIINALKASERSELCSLFKSSADNDLTSNIETLYEEHPEDLVIQLIWNFAQGVSESLPLPFLASNIQRLFDENKALELEPRLVDSGIEFLR
jgi:hypothetical protein